MHSIIHLSWSAVCPWRSFLSSILSCRIRLLSDSTTRQRFQRKFQIIWIPKFQNYLKKFSVNPSIPANIPGFYHKVQFPCLSDGRFSYWENSLSLILPNMLCGGGRSTSLCGVVSFALDFFLCLPDMSPHLSLVLKHQSPEKVVTFQSVVNLLNN